MVILRRRTGKCFLYRGQSSALMHAIGPPSQPSDERDLFISNHKDSCFHLHHHIVTRYRDALKQISRITIMARYDQHPRRGDPGPPPINFPRYTPSYAPRDRRTGEDELYRDRRCEDEYDYERTHDRRVGYDEIDPSYYAVRPAPRTVYYDIEQRGRTSRAFLPNRLEREQDVRYPGDGGTRPAPTLPVHFDDYTGRYRPRGEEPVLRERETYMYTSGPARARAAGYSSASTSSSPVRVRKRVVELSRPIAATYGWGSRSPSPPLDAQARETTTREQIIIPVSSEFEESGPDAFKLSRHMKAPLSRGTSGSNSEDSQLGSTPVAHSPAIGIQGRTVLNVSASQYTGDGTIGGFHSAELKISGDTHHNAKKGTMQPIFKWM
jgi:hypothetical protein